MNTLIKKKNNESKGFSLVEIMVSISIFAIIITTGMGALLNITRTYQISKDRTEVINNINFALESMVRDIRIGDSYYAGDTPSDYGDEYKFNNSSASFKLNIVGAPGRGTILYSFLPEPGSGGYKLQRRREEGGNVTNLSLLNNLGSVVIENAFFRVLGSDPTDDAQASVFIYIEGEDKARDIPFVIQTFVSQRSLDV